MNYKLRFISLIMNGLGKVSVKLAAKVAYFYWTLTIRHEIPNREIKWQESSVQLTKNVNGKNIAVYQWGSAPYVILLHGWNGRGTQLGEFIEPLQDAGFGCIAFDAPGHGKSDGSHTNAMEIAAVICALDKQFGPFSGSIGHSFGVFACANAIRLGSRINAFVGIAPPSNFQWLLDIFSKFLMLSQPVKRALENSIKQKFRIESFSEISPDHFTHSFVNPCLIIHANNDDKVPLEQSENLVSVWPNANLQIAEKLGHVRILRNNAVIDASVKFIADNAKID